MNEHIEIRVGGSVSGQIAGGHDIRQQQHVNAQPVTAQERAELRARLDEVIAEARAAAPPELETATEERMRELDEAVTAKTPDLSTIEYVRNWIGRNLPAVAGSVTGLILHPILGKLVEAAGTALADEFRRRFHTEGKSGD